MTSGMVPGGDPVYLGSIKTKTTTMASHDGLFTYNMGFYDIIIRYTIMMLLGIVGGLTGQLWLMVLAIPVFLIAIMGWCPLHAILGRNTCEPSE
jgi:hypothetical protein